MRNFRKRRIAVDTETDSLDSMQYQNRRAPTFAELRGRATFRSGTPMWASRTALRFSENPRMVPSDFGRDKSREWIFHNAKFDLHVLSRAFDLNRSGAGARYAHRRMDAFR